MQGGKLEEPERGGDQQQLQLNQCLAPEPESLPLGLSLSLHFPGILTARIDTAPFLYSVLAYQENIFSGTY